MKSLIEISWNGVIFISVSRLVRRKLISDRGSWCLMFILGLLPAYKNGQTMNIHWVPKLRMSILSPEYLDDMIDTHTELLETFNFFFSSETSPLC